LILICTWFIFGAYQPTKLPTSWFAFIALPWAINSNLLIELEIKNVENRGPWA
jgi:hypothetical protein